MAVVAVLLVLAPALPAGAVRRHRRAGAAGRHREPGGRRDDRRRLPRDVASPITAVVTLADAGRLRRRRAGAAVLGRPRRRRRRRHRGRQVTGAAGTTARGGASAYDGDPIGERGAGPGRGGARPCPPPAGGAVLVGGQTAELVDLLGSLGGLLPWMALLVVGDDVRAAVPRLRLGGAAGQGADHERAVAGRVVRRDGVDLPGRAPVRAPGLHADRHGGGDPADPRAGHRLRAVDGLRGLPDVPDPRAVRPHRRQHRRRSRPGCSAPAASSPAPRCCWSW